jgi:hypothetical protein
MMNNPTLSEHFMCGHVGYHDEIITFFELGGQEVR